MLLASWRRRRGGVWKGRVCAELTWLWEASEDPPPRQALTHSRDPVYSVC